MSNYSEEGDITSGNVSQSDLSVLQTRKVQAALKDISSCSSPRQGSKKYVPVEEVNESLVSHEEGQPMRVDPEES